MRLILLLLFLVSCGSKPLYKTGDCVRLYSNVSVSDYVVREVTKSKYVISAALIYKGIPSYIGSKYTFDIDQLDEDNSRKINCTEVE